MTLVNTETGEVTEALSEAEAERLSNRISLRLDTIADNYAAVMPMIREAIERRAHEVLGYRSPGEYAADRFGAALSKLGPEMRQAVVRELSDLGMSTRAIAPIVGVSQKTIVKDRQVIPEVSPDQSPEPGRVGLSGSEHTEGEASPEPASETKVGPSPAPRPPVTGVDGKTYTQPTRSDPTFAAKAAVDEFPELTHYTESGRVDEAVRIAASLRSYDEPAERDRRREILRKTIRAEKRRDNPPREITQDEERAVQADLIFIVANGAAQQIEQKGGAATIRHAIAYADPIELENWRDQFLSLARLCEDLAEACQPSLRRIK